MTEKEKEIVEYLKDNKNKGVAFAFMPEEVKNFCRETNSSKFIGYQNIKGWLKVSEEYDFEGEDIIALPKDFELKKESEGGWFEYEIDKNGNFYSADADDKDGRYYHWSEWNTCLANNKDNLIGFGGWQYEEDGAWFTTPQLFGQECFTTLVDYYETCKPVVPNKIRFWREK